MTMTNTDAHRYLLRLRRELAVLPRAARSSIIRDVTDHLEEADDPAAVGDPVMIARAALEDRPSIRPSLAVAAKRVQVVAAIVAAAPALLGLIGSLTGSGSLSLVFLVPLLITAVPPLLAGWSTWWRVSLLCALLQALYVAGSITVLGVGRPVNEFGFVFLLGPLPLLAQLCALVLAVVALVAAPAVLRR